MWCCVHVAQVVLCIGGTTYMWYCCTYGIMCMSCMVCCAHVILCACYTCYLVYVWYCVCALHSPGIVTCVSIVLYFLYVYGCK